MICSPDSALARLILPAATLLCLSLTPAVTVAQTAAPAPAPGDPLQAATDKIAPKLSRLALRRGKVTFRLSEAARVTVKAGRVKRTVHARAGRTTLQLKGVRGGRVRLKVSVVDAAGNRAAASRVVKM